MSYVLRRLRSRIVAGSLPSQASSCIASNFRQPKLSPCLPRLLSTSRPQFADKYEKAAKALNQKGLDEQEQEVRVRQHQIRRPWLREDADKPAVAKDSEGEGRQMYTQGKLLTTPTRLLKLVLPLPMSVEKDKDNNSNGLDYGRSISANDKIQPLALLIHPQQPLSYVERLIQAEIPPVMEDGKEKIPSVYFRAEDSDSDQHDNKPISKAEARERNKKSEGSPSHVASYSGLGHEGPERKHSEKSWVRWSSSTEMGDFIRDAARGREFAIEVEGYNFEMRVSVPSFNDRTYYMRARLRRMSRELDRMSQIKKECDLLAHRSAHRLAKGGFGLLTTWWGVVYYCSFHTDAGWDLVEPVTYLAGLTTIMGGYLWFLYISRDLSYKAAMNVTVSRRQNALYEARGFDIHRWEQLVGEANALRSEIKSIALEYDVDWDEAKDVGEDVKEVLDEERTKRKDKRRSSEKEEDENLTEEENSEGKNAKEEREEKNRDS